MAMLFCFCVSLVSVLLSFSVGGEPEPHDDDYLVIEAIESESNISVEIEPETIYDELIKCVCDNYEECEDQCYLGPRVCLWNNHEFGYKLVKNSSCLNTYGDSFAALDLLDKVSYARSNCTLKMSAPNTTAIVVEDDDLFPSRCGVAEKVERQQWTEDGQLAINAEWPWHVALSFEGENVHCSGTLIGARWVLTSLHCLDRYQFNNSELIDNSFSHSLLVFVFDSDGTEVVRRPETIFIPPYGGSNYHNLDFDVVAIQLNEAVDVMPACLPLDTFSLDKFGDLECVSVAYDQSSPDGALCEVMQKVTVFNTTNPRCEVNDRMNSKLCIGLQDQNGSCSKSSGGGGLFCKTRHNSGEQWMLLGLTSGQNSDAENCESSLKYYERVPFYMEWIDALANVYSFEF